jgi:protein required for attachment to host cells
MRKENDMVRIPNGAHVLVADGRKGLLFRNIGDAVALNLRLIEQVDEVVNPPTAKLGSDRPGRTFDRASGRHSALEETDWHTRAEQDHAQAVAAAVERHFRANDVSRLLIVAPPRTLSVIRNALGNDAKRAIVGEIAKDLTKHPVHEIERLLTF